MNVTLNIENDSELRAHIKDAIRGQVLSIVRDEVMKVIQDEITRKIQSMGETNLGRMVRESTDRVIESILRKEFNVSTWRDEWIEPAVISCVSKYLSEGGVNWKAQVERAAANKIKSLL